MDIILVHGYNVTSTRTYANLPKRLKKDGHNVKNIFLSKYVTLDDDLTFSDLIHAFEAALKDVYQGNYQNKSLSMITHSTGGLVARAWIDQFYGHQMAKLPVKHLIMLAPPNSGSRLAELGKSRLSRLRSLWGVEPGLKILNGLELASELQWEMNIRWMKEKRHHSPNFYPAVITGQAIDKKIWDAIVPATYERGSDGVVRAASANLNSKMFRIYPDGSVERFVMGGVPFFVSPGKAHSDTRMGIMGSIPLSGEDSTYDAIQRVLKVNSRPAYQKLESEFAVETAVMQRQDTHWDGSRLDRYCQVVIKVTDDKGNQIKDFALEVIDENGRGDTLPKGFLADLHKNLVHPDYICMYLNYDQLKMFPNGRLGIRIQTVPDTPLVKYDDFVYYGKDGLFGKVLEPNQTTYVEAVLKRRLNKNIFRLTKKFDVQKIRPIGGDDWI